MGYANNPHARLAARKSTESQQSSDKDTSYIELALEKEIRTKITEEFPDELSLSDEAVIDTMRGKIRKMMSSSKYKPYKTQREFNRVFERICDNLLGSGKLGEYLRSPDMEEINFNSYDNVEILMSGTREVVQIHDMFRTAEECQTMLKRLARRGDLTLDLSNPVGDSDIENGTRITPIIAPVIVEGLGAAGSIRKQRENKITRKELIEGGTATSEILDFLQLCMDHKVSMAFVGPTGSGKTTDMTYFMANMPKKKRFVCIEEGSREMNLARYDAAGHHCERGVMLKTRPSKDENKMKNITQTTLVKTALRLDPQDRLCISEMRGQEALATVKAAGTGQPVVSTFHSSDPRTAYKRLVMMCMEDPNSSSIRYEMLLEMCYAGFPIIAFKDTMGDGVRRYTIISEAYECTPGHYEIIPIFRYIVEDNIYDGDTLVRVEGHHEQVNYISNKLANFLFLHGTPMELVRSYAKPDYSTSVDGDTNGPIENQKIHKRKAPSMPESEQAESYNDLFRRIDNMEKSMETDDPIKGTERDMEINAQIDKVIRKKGTTD